MSVESRRERQRRVVLARHLPAPLLHTLFGVNAADIDTWAAGDIRVTGTPGDTDVVLSCFEYAARTFGLSDAHHWFAIPNTGLGNITPSEAIATRPSAHVLSAAQADTSHEHVSLAALDLDGTPRIAVAGDWHGNTAHALTSIERLAAAGIRTLLHLGDFWLWPGPAGAQYVRRVTKVCDDHDITIYVTDGNHEDHDRLALINPVDGVRWITDRIGYFERGHRWTWANTTFVSLGGAPSVNRKNLTEGKTWWPAEQITQNDVDTATASGPADVMLTHDAPAPGTRTVERIIRDNPQGWPPEALAYATEGRGRLTTAFHALQPRLLLHGHMHVVDRTQVTLPGAPHDTTVISLACDGIGGNLAILDIATLNATVL